MTKPASPATANEAAKSDRMNLASNGRSSSFRKQISG
jgi:hypothetical protein